MKLILDGMQQMMEGPYSGTFDEDFFSDLVQCFDKFDPLLMEAQDKAYAGMMEYAAAGGQRFDEWVPCQEIEDQGLVNLQSVSRLHKCLQRSDIFLWCRHKRMLTILGSNSTALCRR